MKNNKDIFKNGSSNTKIQKTHTNRKYDDNYLQFEFVVKWYGELYSVISMCNLPINAFESKHETITT